MLLRGGHSQSGTLQRPEGRREKAPSPMGAGAATRSHMYTDAGAQGLRGKDVTPVLCAVAQAATRPRTRNEWTPRSATAADRRLAPLGRPLVAVTPVCAHQACCVLG